MPKSHTSHGAVKRLFDLIVSVVALILLSPILATIAVLVRVKLGTPVLFRQIRPGLHGKPFEMLKFRTMTDARAASGELLPDAERLTSFGRFLRSSSLDELPGLISVFTGDMSLVGPRPLLMEYLPLYSRQQARRHDVKPGLTGWAQVNGRNAIGWDEKFRLDIWYVDHQSLWLDLKVIAMTALKVVKRAGIAAEGEATMPKFRGDGGKAAE
jgi:lipopolysaccharide/colanic/teichoic acid biosynthesis glycosyltransferase